MGEVLRLEGENEDGRDKRWKSEIERMVWITP